MRTLTGAEIESIKILTENSVELTLIEPTETGLDKSIMDATAPVRAYLKEKGIHDYECQKQGPTHKIFIKSYILEGNRVIDSQASLYRPVSKTGDPRIWFKNLKSSYVESNDILAIIVFEKELYVINLTKCDIDLCLQSVITNPVRELIEHINKASNRIANELLLLLRKIASAGPIKADLNADTSVGRTLERLLNIKTNSSKKPDYKGIELKSYRDERDNRKNLFAQVPNWEISKFKSSSQILNEFGYPSKSKNGEFKLYCTVSSMKYNSQGLILKVDEDTGLLIETSNKLKVGDFVVWLLEKLHERLLEKHNETFWIAANSKVSDGCEYFTYTNVEHTKKPIVSQFDILLNQGLITLDHLIKRTVKGKVSEKGPLFKIEPKALSLLFPPSQQYEL